MFWPSFKQTLPHFVPFTNRPLLLIVTVGLGVSGVAWWVAQSQCSWLEVDKGIDGVAVGVHVVPQNIPGGILAHLPSPDNNTPLRDPARIKALAEKYGLYQFWETNPHLRFDDGVINYWSKQGRPAWELEIQFLSRQIVLEAAESAKARIPSVGDLSRWTDRVYPILFKKAQEM